MEATSPIAWFWQLATVFVLALAVRGAFLASQWERLQDDPDGYRQIANELRSSGQFARRDGDGPSFRTAYRPPLYPMLLAATGTSSFAVATLQAILGGATALGAFLLARGLGQQWGAYLAAVFTTLDPLLLNQSALVMTETLAAALTLAAVALLTVWSQRTTWRWAALAGVSIGLCILCRSTYLLWPPLLAMAFLAEPLFKRQMNRSQFWPLAIFVSAAFLVILPWGIHNTLVFGKPIFTTTHGGYTLLLGNNPHFYRFVRQGTWTIAWDAEEFHSQWQQRRSQVTNPAQELDEEKLAYVWAKESMLQEPGSFALAALYRWRQFFVPFPNRLNDQQRLSTSQVAVAIWYGLLYLAALGSWRWWQVSPTRRFAGANMLALLFLFAAIHTFYWADMRMRAPLMPLLAIAASAGLEFWGARLNRRMD